jgi:rare lipoprotein A
MRRLLTFALAALLAFGSFGCASTNAGGAAKPQVRLGAKNVGTATTGAPNVARGKASWYGKEYRGRKTASGEVFDPAKLTAATNSSYRFGTRLRVTATDSGRSVIVRVNDRFGNHRNRLIDLSEAAFARIAPLERGVTEVTVEIIP